MKVVCICDAGAPEMLMQNAKKLPGCDVELFIDPAMLDIRHLTMVERTAEKGGSEAFEASQELIAAVTGADAIVTHVTPVNKAMLDAAPDLKYLGVMRTGYEHINMDVCNERGVTVFNAEGRNAVAVADQTVALMLCEMRNIARGHAALMNGKWIKTFPNVMYSHDMKNCTVGIIGVGKIGTLVAQRLKGFGCRILGCDLFLPEEEILRRGCDEAVSKEELLRRSDFVTMHMIYNEGDPHLIGAEELAMMKKTAILVNCARSGLVDTDALIAALQENLIGGAAIDVFDQEPLPEDHPFLSLPNVTLTPHSAGTSIDAFMNSAVIILGQFEQILRGETPRNKVN
ncbi:MAG: 2-hydroxyacid dehydrogenase [Mogibacterium sp.]|nr:2-hydroxyacid dehydrogenase [Mogibacterium sp.]